MLLFESYPILQLLRLCAAQPPELPAFELEQYRRLKDLHDIYQRVENRIFELINGESCGDGTHVNIERSPVWWLKMTYVLCKRLVHVCRLN